MSEDRVIVLTGSSSGLGAALLKHFAKKGFGVVMNYVVDSAARKFTRNYSKLQMNLK
jgi:NAD(P)-dependent dehydrogenase (short-subunit alcohol dehydrogenase family)